MTKKLKVAEQADAAAPDEQAKVADEHAGHTKIDSHVWDEAAGVAVGFQLCSCGASLASEA